MPQQSTPVGVLRSWQVKPIRTDFIASNHCSTLHNAGWEKQVKAVNNIIWRKQKNCIIPIAYI